MINRSWQLQCFKEDVRPTLEQKLHWEASNLAEDRVWDTVVARVGHNVEGRFAFVLRYRND